MYFVKNQLSEIICGSWDPHSKVTEIKEKSSFNFDGLEIRPYGSCLNVNINLIVAVLKYIKNTSSERYLYLPQVA